MLKPTKKLIFNADRETLCLYEIMNFLTGSTELGLQHFEPLDIPELIVGEGKGPVNVVQHFKDVQLWGLTGSKVLDVR